MKILGIIPARGGSKGVPRKNIRLVAGKPLITYTIEAAKHSQLLTRWFVSTEDSEISAIANTYEAEVLERPRELAADDTPMLAVINQVLQTLGNKHDLYDYIAILQPTSPLRTSSHIDEALQYLITQDADSIVSVSKVPGHYNPHWQFTIVNGELSLFTGQEITQIISRRQALPPTYTRNGAIYAFKRDTLTTYGNIYGKHCIPFEMSQDDSVNIDDFEDLRLVEKILMERSS